MTSKAATVAAYMKELPPDRRRGLDLLRKLFKKVAPGGTESMMYGMPGYSLNGKPLFAMNAQKHYLALYVAPESLRRHRKSLGKLSCGKCCIRFKTIEDLPLDVAETILCDSRDACLRSNQLC